MRDFFTGMLIVGVALVAISLALKIVFS